MHQQLARLATSAPNVFANTCVSGSVQSFGQPFESQLMGTSVCDPHLAFEAASGHAAPMPGNIHGSNMCEPLPFEPVFANPLASGVGSEIAQPALAPNFCLTMHLIVFHCLVA